MKGFYFLGMLVFFQGVYGKFAILCMPSAETFCQNEFNSLSGTSYVRNCIPSDLRQCIMKKCHIVSVDPSFFAATSRMEKIDFSFNYISILAAETFRVCSKVRILALNDNLLTDLYPDIFKPMVRLQKLDLRNNLLFVGDYSIKIVETPVTYELIDFYNNNPDLSNLIASRNYPNTTAVRNMLDRKLQRFKGRRPNPYTKLVTILQQPMNCKKLNLTHNSIPELPFNCLSSFFSLIDLDLSHNSLTSLEPDVFKYNTNLIHVDLAYNLIRTIGDNIFQNTRLIAVLFMNNNQIEKIPDDLFRPLVRMKRLSLANNLIGTLPPRVFSMNSQLTKVDLSNNKIKLIHVDTFVNTVMIDELSLANNLLGNFRADHITNMLGLRKLHLDKNRLTKLDEQYVTFVNLTELSLSCNLFTNIPQRFFKIAGIGPRKVYLHGNPWKCGCLKNNILNPGNSFVSYEISRFSDGKSVTCIVENDDVNTCDDKPISFPFMDEWKQALKKGPALCKPLLNEYIDVRIG